MAPAEVIEAAKAVVELNKLFSSSQVLVKKLLPDFVKLVADNDGQAWFQGVSQVGDLSLDDAHGALIVCLSALAQVKVKIKDTPCEEILKEIFGEQES